MIRRILRLLDDQDARTFRRMLAGLIVCAVLQGVGFVLLVPILEALLGPQPAAAWPWIGALGAVVAVYAVAHWDSSMAGYRVGSRLSRRVHHLLGDHVATLPLGWFTATRTGDLAMLAGKSVTDIMGVPAHLLRPVLTAFVTPLVVLAGMFVLDWRLAVAALVTVPLVAVTYRWTTRLIGRFDHRLHDSIVDAGGRVLEFAQMQPEYRAFRRTVDGSAILDAALVERHRAARTLLLGAVPGFISFTLVVQLGFTLVLVVGAYLAVGGTVAVPELLAILVLAVRFVEPLITAADLGGALRMARNALDRVDAILDTPPLPEPASGSTNVGDADVEFDDVHFGYRDGEPVLTGLSLRMPARSMTALVGPSGSGKTTVTRLIARFFDVDAGTVRVGGVDVRDRTMDDLMSRLSLVFQDVYLFEGTILENIRLGRPNATDAEVHDAGRSARVDEIVARLPHGWDTQVGEGGTALSGGERQRVSIARALLKDTPIVLLDEATAALDPENDAAVQDALTALTADRTLVVVAHRLQTIAGAHQIAFLEHGRLAELGTHAQLLALEGRYARFWAERSRAQGWRLNPTHSWAAAASRSFVDEPETS